MTTHPFELTIAVAYRSRNGLGRMFVPFETTPEDETQEFYWVTFEGTPEKDRIHWKIICIEDGHGLPQEVASLRESYQMIHKSSYEITDRIPKPAIVRAILESYSEDELIEIAIAYRYKRQYPENISYEIAGRIYPNLLPDQRIKLIKKLFENGDTERIAMFLSIVTPILASINQSRPEIEYLVAYALLNNTLDSILLKANDGFLNYFRQNKSSILKFIAQTVESNRTKPNMLTKELHSIIEQTALL